MLNGAGLGIVFGGFRHEVNALPIFQAQTDPGNNTATPWPETQLLKAPGGMRKQSDLLSPAG